VEEAIAGIDASYISARSKQSEPNERGILVNWLPPEPVVKDSIKETLLSKVAGSIDP
jgi:hypothetical protein